MMLSIFSYAYLPSTYFYSEMSIPHVCLFFNGCLKFFPTVEFYGFFEYFGYQSPSLGMSFANVFSSLWLVVILLTMAITEYKIEF